MTNEELLVTCDKCGRMFDAHNVSWCSCGAYRTNFSPVESHSGKASKKDVDRLVKLLINAKKKSGGN